jgi:cytochrome c oxidase subunit 4
MEHSTNHENGHKHEEHHIVSYATNIQIWLVLLVLTILTVVMAFVNAGDMNVVIALGIATVKATLVVTVFMHVMYDPPIVRWFLASCATIFFVVFALMATEYMNRYFPFY